MQKHCYLPALLLLALPKALVASPINITYQDDALTCDQLVMPLSLEELGSQLASFPTDSLIDHATAGVGSTVCEGDNQLISNPVVEIINLTSRVFSEVWYVADSATVISNFDGFVEDSSSPAPLPVHFAFRIDNVLSDPAGKHHPLVFESVPDGVFSAGETWRFVLQDYVNALGAAPDAITSYGVAAGSIDIFGAPVSSGSIIAVPIPELSVEVILLWAAACGLRSRHSALMIHDRWLRLG